MDINTLHSSLDMSNVPRPGGTVNLLGNLTPGRSADADRIHSMLAGLEPQSRNAEIVNDFDSDFGGDSGDDDDEFDLDLDNLPSQLTPPRQAVPSSPAPSVLGVASAAQAAQPQLQPQQQPQPMIPTSPPQQTNSPEDASDESQPANKKWLIIGAAALVVVILVFAAVRGLGKKEEPVTSSPTQPSSTGQKFFADVLETTDSITYMDSMVIEKYITLEQDTCRYIFEGYAENARAFLLADVDLATYNTYKTGARVQIVYERITLNGKDYFMKVRVINEN